MELKLGITMPSSKESLHNKRGTMKFYIMLCYSVYLSSLRIAFCGYYFKMAH